MSRLAVLRDWLVQFTNTPEFKRAYRIVRETQPVHQPCDRCDHIRVVGGLERCYRCGLQLCAFCWTLHVFQQGHPEYEDCRAYLEEYAHITAAIRTNRVDARPTDRDYAKARQALRELIRSW